MALMFESAAILNSKSVASKTFLFGNPHTFLCTHLFNGLGFDGWNTAIQVFDITEAGITKGGDVHLSRADNDFYPRNGGMADAIFQMRVTSKNPSAFNVFTKGDELGDIAVQYEGRASARGYTLQVGLSGGMIDEDISFSGQHGAEPMNASLSVQATIPVHSTGAAYGGTNGPYHIPWMMSVELDGDRDDTWAPEVVAIP